MMTKEQYQQMITIWSAKKYHTAAEHIAYNILRGKDAKLGFTPIASHNTNKITSNNCDPYNGFSQAKSALGRRIGLLLQEPSDWAAKRMVADKKAVSYEEAMVILRARIDEAASAEKKWFRDTFGLELTFAIAAALRDAK